MEQRVNKQTVVAGLAWRLAERCGAQGVSFVVTIILARLLAPELYGTVALITVFTTILQVFVESGFGSALVQKKNADELDFSTVFYFNIVWCVVLYGLLFFAAPWIALFFADPLLTPLTRVLGLTVLISGVKNIQEAYVSRTMQFKRFFFSTVGGTLVSAALGIGMAYAGFGVWALVAQSLCNTLVDTIVLWVTVGWRPKKMFSFARLRGLFSFGSKVLASSLLDTVYSKFCQLLIAKWYSATDLAYYNKGSSLPNIIIVNLTYTINSVLLPVMANEQDDTARVKRLTRMTIQTSGYLIWPMMMGAAVCARPLLLLLLTEKWVACVPFLQLFCISYALYPIHTSNMNAMKAIGRSDLFLKLEMVKKLVGITLIFLSLPLGPLAMAFTAILTNFVSVLFNALPNQRLLGYRLKEQLMDVLPPCLLSVAMALCVWPLQGVANSAFLQLLIQGVAGAGVYLLGSVVFRLAGLKNLWGICTGLRNRKTKQAS